jgi:hypothetical protein
MNSLVLWDERTSWEIRVLRKFGWNRTSRFAAAGLISSHTIEGSRRDATGQWKEFQETYWGTCINRWGAPYLCQKTRTIRRFCYQFSSIQIAGASKKTVACEGHDRYEWWEYGWFGFGNWADPAGERCYNGEKTRSGSC